MDANKCILRIFSPKEIRDISIRKNGTAYNNRGNYRHPPFKAIIGLTGKNDIGKSTALRELICLLLGNNSLPATPMDIRVLLKYNNHDILICTSGDNREILEDNCMLFEDQVPDIFVTAVNFSNGPFRIFDYICEKNKKNTLFQTKINKNRYNEIQCTLGQQQQNVQCAQIIKDIIDHL